MNKLFSAVFVLIILFVYPHTSIAQYSQWGDLKPGTHSVGYRVINRFDYRRYVRPKLNFEGNRNQGERAVPIQISIWYPAVAAKNKSTMLFEGYVYAANENTLKPLSEKEKESKIEGIRFIVKLLTTRELSAEQINTILKTPTAVIKDAKTENGTFPVIIAGTGGNPGLNNVLFEYLASLGYIVFCSPSIDRTNSLSAVNPHLALDDRIGNLEYLLDFAKTFPSADYSRLGVLGVNFDGMAATLFEMKHMQADAIVSLDGGEGKEGSETTLLQSVFFVANNLRVPYFTVLQDEKNPPPFLKLSQKVFDTLLYADRYYYVLNEISHGYLTTNLGILSDLPPEKRTAYRFIYSGIGNFFNAYVKKSETDLAIIKKSALENGYPEALFKTEIKKTALPKIPTNDELEQMYQEEQYEKMANALKQAKAFNPKLSGWENRLNLYGFRLMRIKKYADAIKIYQLNTELHPENISLLNRLAESYEVSGDKENAKITARRLLDLLDKKPVLTTEEKALKILAEKRIEK